MDFSSDNEFGIKAVSEAQKSVRKVFRNQIDIKNPQPAAIKASAFFGENLARQIAEIESESKNAQTSIFRKIDQEELKHAYSRCKNIDTLKKIAQKLLETRISFQSKLIGPIAAGNLIREDPVNLKRALVEFQNSALKLFRKVAEPEPIGQDADSSRPGVLLRRKRRAEWETWENTDSKRRWEDIEVLVDSVKRRKILPMLNALRSKFPLSRGLSTFDQSPSRQIADFMAGESFVRCIDDIKIFDDSFTYTFLLKKFLTGAAGVVARSGQNPKEEAVSTPRKGDSCFSLNHHLLGRDRSLYRGRTLSLEPMPKVVNFMVRIN